MSVNFSNQLAPNNYPTNQRAVIDNNFVVAVALGAATTTSNTVSTNAINLGVPTPYSTTEIFNVQLIIGASTGSNNSKNVNAVLQATTANTDGTPNSTNWVNIALLANPLLQATDNNFTGFANVVANIKLEPNQTQFIRGTALTEANGGAPTGSLTVQLLF